MNRILGIDPGSARCGWAVVESDSNNQKLIASGCVKTHIRDSAAQRLCVLHDKLTAIVKKYKPKEAAVEELFFVQNVKTGIVVGQARGVVLLTLAQADIEIFEYKPNQVKLALTGFGHADKKQVQSMVKLILRMDKAIVQDDTADAIAIALCHQQSSPILNLNHANRMITNDARISHDSKGLIYPELSYKIVGVLQKVSNEIGFVLNERYYYPLIEDSLKRENISYEKQIPANIDIEGVRGRYFFDYLVDEKVVLEIKVGSRFSKKDVDQIMAYLRATGKQLGILARFTRSGVLTKRFLLGKN